MHDGAVVFKSKIDNSELQKDLNKAKREIEKSQKSISESEMAKLPLEKQAENINIKLKEARNELEKYQTRLSKIQSVTLNPASKQDYEKAAQLIPGAVSKVAEQQKNVENLEKEWSKVNGKIEKYNSKITVANANIERQKEKAAEITKKLSSGSAKMAAATEKAQQSAERFKKRIASLAGQAFVFSLISKALQGIVKYMGKALKSNSEFTSELAKLKGALLTAFQPIYEFLVPVLMALMRIATGVVTAIARVASLLGGKSMSQYAKSAEALYDEANAIDETGEAAKKAQKSLAGFDEINQLSAPDSGSAAESVAASADFSAFDGSMVMAAVDELVVYLSGALLVIGIILAFSGVNIPLGIGLMAAGAIGLGSEVATNWDTVQNILKEQAGLIAGISAILLVIGIVLCFCGVLPLGIGLIVVGAAGLVTEAVVNWDSIKGPITDVLASLLAIVSGAAMVLGVLLILSGVGLGLGLALLAAGIAGSVTAWNLSDNPITRFVKNMANTIIGFVNMIIEAINSLFHIKFDGLKIAGVQIIPQIDFKLLNIPQIPLLAKGAVLPPNKPFMAMVGDQKHGTNIEAPLSTIQEAVAEVMADYEAANLAGHEATVAALREILAAVLGIEVGDTTIGMAANRYNQKMAIIKGGGAK